MRLFRVSIIFGIFLTNYRLFIEDEQIQTMLTVLQDCFCLFFPETLWNRIIAYFQTFET